MAERRISAGGKGHLRSVVLAHNDLAAKWELLLAKLDADGGVLDTDYAGVASA